MDPLRIRRERCAEVIRLICRMSKHDEQNKATGSETTSGRKRVIRRPAGDDWF